MSATVAEIVAEYGLSLGEVENAVSATEARLSLMMEAWKHRADFEAFTAIMVAGMEVINAEGMATAAEVVSGIAERLDGDRRMVLKRASQAIHELIVLNLQMDEVQ